MKIKDMADEALRSGITPIRLSYDTVRFFKSDNLIIRSFIVIESLELGVLTYKQYRFVAGRSKRGTALVQKHIEKLFEAYPEIVSNSNVECVTIPVYSKTLMDGALSEMLFKMFATHPEVSQSKICIELSADILYEDIELAKKRVEELRGYGIKIAINEAGDEFCPVFRLSELDFDYAFADESVSSKLGEEDSRKTSMGLTKFLHLSNVKVFAPELENEGQLNGAKETDFDGYSLKCGNMTLPIKEVDE